MAVEVRKRVNTLDNLTTTKAVDALLNAETVALFNNRCAAPLTPPPLPPSHARRPGGCS